MFLLDSTETIVQFYIRTCLQKFFIQFRKKNTFSITIILKTNDEVSMNDENEIHMGNKRHIK